MLAARREYGRRGLAYRQLTVCQMLDIKFAGKHRTRCRWSEACKESLHPKPSSLNSAIPVPSESMFSEGGWPLFSILSSFPKRPYLNISQVAPIGASARVAWLPMDLCKCLQSRALGFWTLGSSGFWDLGFKGWWGVCFYHCKL